MAVVVVMVTVARAQFRQTQEDGHEQQRPANVPDIFLGQLHDGGESTDNRVFSWRKTKQSRENNKYNHGGITELCQVAVGAVVISHGKQRAECGCSLFADGALVV